LPSWDAELARHALELSSDRSTLVGALAEPFARWARQLGLSGESRLEYRPRSKVSDVEGFVAELQAQLPTDLNRGFSTYGPHRDELAILRDGRELRSFGSQGEQRLALLALLLAERFVLARERSHVPLMLLDDVMSELDVTRRELLSAELQSSGQSVIATTDLAHVPGSGDGFVTRLRISPGAILGEALAA
jgi:DNA replication and repair protein RecF